VKIEKEVVMGRCEICDKDTGWGNGERCKEHAEVEIKDETLDNLLNKKLELGGYIGAKDEMLNYTVKLNQLAFKEILERLSKIENTLSPK
jgi:hypothetical protein